jgi:queuine tRNA-ribosyltransferase
MPLRFEIECRQAGGTARTGRLHTAHGSLETPAFFPVGTYGTVKGIAPDELRELGAEALLVNALHLHLRPGEETIARLGGIQRFMGWDGPVLSDSGGYQIYSLEELRKVTEDGVQFRSPLDGDEVFLTPEGMIEIERRLGVDLAACLDQCVRLPATKQEEEEGVRRTTAWAARCREAWGEGEDGRGLFGIVQGGLDLELRERSAKEVTPLAFDGYAIGGLSVGEEKSDTFRVLEHTMRFVPDDVPRHLFGVGTPSDILEGVRRGIDMFDCVIPTRHARNGTILTWREGSRNMRAARFAEDAGPPDPDCECGVCRKFSAAYLRHLLKRGEMLGGRLLTLHNLHLYLEWMRTIRAAIQEGRLDALEAPPD